MYGYKKSEELLSIIKAGLEKNSKLVEKVNFNELNGTKKSPISSVDRALPDEKRLSKEV